MSIQYAVASALARGCVDEESYRDLNDAKVQELAARVTVDAADPTSPPLSRQSKAPK